MIAKNFAFDLRNPLKTWWRAHYVFKAPRLKVQFFKERNSSTLAKVLDITCHDAQWYLVHGMVRYKCPPTLCVVIGAKYGIYITLNYPSDYERLVWNAIASYLYNKIPLERAICDDIKDFVKWS